MKIFFLLSVISLFTPLNAAASGLQDSIKSGREESTDPEIHGQSKITKEEKKDLPSEELTKLKEIVLEDPLFKVKKK